jgi:hypothetical protein
MPWAILTFEKWNDRLFQYPREEGSMLLWISAGLMVVALVAHVLIEISRLALAECFRPYPRIDDMPSCLQLSDADRCWIRIGLVCWRVRLPAVIVATAILFFGYLRT